MPPHVHVSIMPQTVDCMAQTWTTDLPLRRNACKRHHRQWQDQRPTLRKVAFANAESADVNSSTKVYTYPHLLGLPLEMRQQIWQTAAEDMTADTHRSPWLHKPLNQYRGLPQTCRQIYEEIQPYWYTQIVPWNRLRVFLGTSVNRTTIRRFRSLTFDVRLDASPDYLTGLQHFLFKAQPYLRELRLHFFGPDMYGRKVYGHGCGNHVHEASEQKLLIDGQRFDDFLPLWRRIAALGQLETLVISNANLQLWDAMILYRKPYLQNLFISSDPRSALHLQQDMEPLGFLLTAGPRISQFPPIKALHLPANATITASAAVAKVAPTLEHLTWIVPDISLQATSFEALWLDRTAHLLSALRWRGENLRTLRICLAGSGIHQEPVYGNLIGAFREHLRHFSSLRHLELHFKNKNPWFGKELLAVLPDNLRHLYVSDRVLKSSDLLHGIWQRYLVANHKPRAHAIMTAINHGNIPLNSVAGPIPQSEDHGPWLIDAFSFNYVNQYDVHNKAQDNALHMILRHKSSEELEFEPGIRADKSHIDPYIADHIRSDLIGEHPSRQDYIPFSSGQLRFIHFEYDTKGSEEAPNSRIARLHRVLLVNGRLLDRYRNRHLRQFDHGCPIPPRLARRTKCKSAKVDACTETATHSSNMMYAILLHSIHAVEHSDPREKSKDLAKLDCSPHWRYYFGNEDEAVEIFEQEATAQVEDLQAYTYPVVQDVVVDGHCQWTSPGPELSNPRHKPAVHPASGTVEQTTREI